MKRKYMNTDKARWKEPELITLISEVGVVTNIQTVACAENFRGGKA